MWRNLAVLLVLALAGTTQTTSINATNSNPSSRSSFVQIGSKSYYIQNNSKHSWIGAVHYCRRLNAHLAFINSDSELNAVSNYFRTQGIGSHWFWVAGNDLINQGNWYSIATGQPLSYTHWSPGQPDNDKGNEHCTNIWLNGNRLELNDWNCDNLAYFVCQLP